MNSIIINQHEAQPEQEAKIQGKPPKVLKKIGTTTYEVGVHFSETSRETLSDKILRLIRSETLKEAVNPSV
jgi:hypothetical protein